MTVIDMKAVNLQYQCISNTSWRCAHEMDEFDDPLAELVEEDDKLSVSLLSLQFCLLPLDRPR